MRKIFLGLATGVLGLVLTGPADAHSGHDRHGHGHGHRVGAYYRSHGVRFRGGYYYKGREHHHWARRVWSPECHRYHYWDPSLNCYYYWYAPGNCYYPVSYCP
jgi:hypothetical protein